MMPRKEKVRIRIALTNGRWYAHAGNNSAIRAALVPAINYVRRMNAVQGRR